MLSNDMLTPPPRARSPRDVYAGTSDEGAFAFQPQVGRAGW